MLSKEFCFVDVHHSLNDIKTRWERININELDRFRKRYKNLNIFATVQQFSANAYDEGQLQYAPLFFDFDVKDPFSFEDMQKDVCKLRNYLFSEWQLGKTEVRFWFSGNRGFHIMVDPVVLGIEPHANLTHILKGIAFDLKKNLNLKTLDGVVYTIRRMWRIPNSQHSKSNLFKIELYDSEIMLPESDIRKLAEKPREELYDAQEYAYKINEVASEQFAKLFKKSIMNLNDDVSGVDVSDKLKYLPSAPVCIEDLRNNGIKEAGKRNNATMILATYFKNEGKPLNDCKKELMSWAAKIPDSMTDTKGKERENNTKSCVEAVYKEEKYQFRCEYVWGLGGWVKCNSDDCPVRKYALNHNRIAETIMKENKIICGVSNEDGKKRFVYSDGVYVSLPDAKVDAMTAKHTGKAFCISKARETRNTVDVKSIIPMDRINADKRFLVLKNGVFDTETFNLTEHTPEILSTIKLNVNYNPAAKCPQYDKFSREVLDKPELACLEAFFGTCLTTDTSFEKFLILKGLGGNGKGLMLDILGYILGDYSSSVGLEEFKSTFSRAHMFGKLANICRETDAKAEEYESFLNAFTSGDKIKAEQKHKDPFEYRPTCKLIFSINNMPRISDKTSAFYRRCLIIPFEKSFDESTANTDMKHQRFWEDELDGIFLRFLEGLRRFRKVKIFNETTKMLQEKEEVREENNPVYAFAKDECLPHDSMYETKEAVYEEYKSYCFKNGFKPLSMKKFGKTLRAVPSFRYLDAGSRTADTRIWKGFCLKKRLSTPQNGVEGGENQGLEMAEKVENRGSAVLWD